MAKKKGAAAKKKKQAATFGDTPPQSPRTSAESIATEPESLPPLAPEVPDIPVEAADILPEAPEVPPSAPEPPASPALTIRAASPAPSTIETLAKEIAEVAPEQAPAEELREESVIPPEAPEVPEAPEIDEFVDAAEKEPEVPVPKEEPEVDEFVDAAEKEPETAAPAEEAPGTETVEAPTALEESAEALREAVESQPVKEIVEVELSKEETADTEVSKEEIVEADAVKEEGAVPEPATEDAEVAEPVKGETAEAKVAKEGTADTEPTREGAEVVEPSTETAVKAELPREEVVEEVAKEEAVPEEQPRPETPREIVEEPQSVEPEPPAPETPASKAPSVAAPSPAVKHRRIPSTASISSHRSLIVAPPPVAEKSSPPDHEAYTPPSAPEAPPPRHFPLARQHSTPTGYSTPPFGGYPPHTAHGYYPPPPGPTSPPYYHGYGIAAYPNGYSAGSPYGMHGTPTPGYQGAPGAYPGFSPFGPAPPPQMRRHDSIDSRGSCAGNELALQDFDNEIAVQDDSPELLTRISSAIPDLHMLLSRYRESHGKLGLREALLRKAEAERADELKRQEAHIATLTKQLEDAAKEHSAESNKLRLEIGNLEEKIAEHLAAKKQAQDALAAVLAEKDVLIKEKLELEQSVSEEKNRLLKEFEDWRSTTTETLEKQKQDLAFVFVKQQDDAEKNFAAQTRAAAELYDKEKGEMQVAFATEKEQMHVQFAKEKEEMQAAFMTEKEEMQAAFDRSKKDLETNFNTIREEAEAKLASVQTELEEALKQAEEDRANWDAEREAFSTERESFTAERDALIKEREEEKLALQKEIEDALKKEEESKAARDAERETLTKTSEEEKATLQKELEDAVKREEEGRAIWDAERETLTKEREEEKLALQKALEDAVKKAEENLANWEIERDALVKVSVDEKIALQQRLEDALKKEDECRTNWEIERETLNKERNEEKVALQKGFDDERVVLITQYQKEKDDLQQGMHLLQTELTKKWEEEKETLQKENLHLKAGWDDDKATFEKIVGELKTMADNLGNEKGRLQKMIECFGTVTELKSKGDAFYLDAFGQLSKQIIEVASTHFTHLPVHPPAEILDKIPGTLPSFVANTPACQQIRAAYITHTIANLLTFKVFTPFLFSLGKRYDKADDLFSAMSAQLRGKSTRKEAVWRQHTLMAAFTTTDAKQQMNTAAGKVVDDIMYAIRYFTDPNELEKIRVAIRRIVKLAAETWRYARLEREMITARMPAIDAVLEGENESFWPAHEADLTALSLAEDAPSERKLLLRLLPVIEREPIHESYQITPEDENDTGCIYSHGLALYSDSPAVQARLRDLQAGTPQPCEEPTPAPISVVRTIPTVEPEETQRATHPTNSDISTFPAQSGYASIMTPTPPTPVPVALATPITTAPSTPAPSRPGSSAAPSRVATPPSPVQLPRSYPLSVQGSQVALANPSQTSLATTTSAATTATGMTLPPPLVHHHSTSSVPTSVHSPSVATNRESASSVREPGSATRSRPPSPLYAAQDEIPTLTRNAPTRRLSTRASSSQHTQSAAPSPTATPRSIGMVRSGSGSVRTVESPSLRSEHSSKRESRGSFGESKRESRGSFGETSSRPVSVRTASTRESNESGGTRRSLGFMGDSRSAAIKGLYGEMPGIVVPLKVVSGREK